MRVEASSTNQPWPQPYSQTVGPLMDACTLVVAQKAKDVQAIGVRLSQAQTKK